MGLRILITGGTGFIGRHVASTLAGSGHDVTLAVRACPSAPAGFKTIGHDLLQNAAPAALFSGAPFDRLIHLAWTVEHGRFWKDPANLDWIAATLALVRAAHKAGVGHVACAGTCFEYDWPEGADCDEAATGTAPHTLYDASKDACRRALEAYATETGLRLAWARLFHLYGENENPHRLVPYLCRSLSQGQPVTITRGTIVRDFMHVRDAGRAIAAVSESAFCGPINIASGQQIAIHGIAEKIGALAGRPDLVSRTRVPDAHEPPRITADVTRLVSLGFRPAVTLDQGLAGVFEHITQTKKASHQ